MIRGILFDLDGVLLSTDEMNYQSWKALADRLGIPFDRTINNRCRGVSRQASLAVILERSPIHYSEEEKARFCEEKNKTYLSFLKKMTPADVKIENRKTLSELREKGYRLALASSSKNARFVLNQVDLVNAFDAIADGNEITHSKPDPEIFLLAAKKIGCVPEECAVIEDAKAGIEAAKRGGFLSVGYGSAVETVPASCHIQRLPELLSLPEILTKEKKLNFKF